MARGAENMKVLSLGAGVQSTTILLMACKDEIKKPDVAIFADTGWESSETYKHLEWLKGISESNGISLLVVRAGNIRDDILNAAELKSRFASMPMYCLNNGRKGMLRRQCTSAYKIVPIHKKIRELLGYKPKQKIAPDAVEQWVGISTDEAQRIFGFYNHRWLNNTFPLIDMDMSRAECELWLQENYPYLKVVKSACVGCPFHTNCEWREVRNKLDEWQSAVEFDRAIRNIGGQIKSKELYLHKSLKPLEEVDVRSEEEKGQLTFGFYKEGRELLFAKTNALWLPHKG